MPLNLSTSVFEGSSIVITAKFSNENKQPVTPYNVMYSLYNGTKGISNGRQNVPVTANNPTVVIALTGADLTMATNGKTEDFKLVLRGQYDSTAGTGLNVVDSVTFTVQRP